MYLRHYFVLGLLSLKGCFSTNLNSGKVLAFSDRNAILPCSLNIPGSDYLPTVEWSKEGLKPNVVFLFRNGFETFEMKNPAFEFRTNFFMREVKNGNVSLRISNVRLSDGGTYQCLVIHRNGTRVATEVQLVVAAVSDPKLSVDKGENERMTAACEVTCWLPAPLMVILDENGNNITDTVEIRKADPSECYTVRQTATVPSHTHRVACRVDQQQTNQSRTAEILISAQRRSNSFRIAGFYVEVIASVFFFGLCVFFVWWACSKYAERKQETQRNQLDHELTDVPSEGMYLLTDGADNTANYTIESLRTDVANLRSENRRKDETILMLLRKINCVAAVNHQDRPRCSLPSWLEYPECCRSSDHNTENGELLHHVTKRGSLQLPNPVSLSEKNSRKREGQNQRSNPVPGHSKYRNVRYHSSPALMSYSSSAAAVKGEDKTDFPPRTDTQTNPGRNGGLVDRRHSLGLFPFFQSRNSYALLPHLKEK